MRALLMTCIALGLTLSLFWPVVAQGQPAPSPASFFFEEFLGGTLGAVLTGPGATAVLVNFACSGSSNPELCHGVATVQIRPFLFLVGVPLGSTLGIWGVGLYDGVDGNITGAAIGSLLGGASGLVEAFAAYVVIDWLFSPQAKDYLASSDAPEYLKRGLPPLIEFLRPYEYYLKEIAFEVLPTMTAALFGTEGFNTGARLSP